MEDLYLYAILAQVRNQTHYASRLLQFWLQPKPNPHHTPAAVQLTPHLLRLPAGPQSSLCLVAESLKPLPVQPLSSSLVVEAPMPGVWPQSSPRLAAFWPVPPYRPTWTRRKRHYGVRLLRWSSNTPRSSSGGSGVSSNGLLLTFGLGMRPCCEVNSLHHLLPSAPHLGR